MSCCWLDWLWQRRRGRQRSDERKLKSRINFWELWTRLKACYLKEYFMGFYLLLIEATEKAFFVYFIFRIMNFLSAFVENIFSLSVKANFLSKSTARPHPKHDSLNYECSQSADTTLNRFGTKKWWKMAAVVLSMKCTNWPIFSLKQNENVAINWEPVTGGGVGVG